MAVLKEGQKFSPCDAASHGLTAYQGAPCKKFLGTDYYNIRRLQLYNSFSVSVSGMSLFIVIKYTRLKPRLLKNKFKHEKINPD